MNSKLIRFRPGIVAVALLVGALLISASATFAEPALWVVKGPHATVYLFGSVHALKKDVPWRSAKIDAAIQQSGSLWLEVPNIEDTKALQPLILQLGVDQEHPLSSKLTKEQAALLDKIAKDMGIPGGETAMEPLKPWLAAVTLSAAPMMKAGFDLHSGVEEVLKPEFDKAGKPVKGFETAEQQLHFFADLPDKEQLDYLNSELNDFDQAAETFKKTVTAWYAGDETALDQIFSAEFRDKYPNLYQILIVKRNQDFASQIDGLLKGDGTVFVAIGAGHLVGRDSVPVMLEKMGYKVVRQ
ncbi:MAG: TraB/GumN family protein [Terracidiphilus sp.]|jgi:uncharacterized protein YbaP (TraB family)